MNDELRNRIGVDPKVMVGKPVIQGTRIPEALRMLVPHGGSIDLMREMEEARRDKMFLADVKATMEDFKFADVEIARRLAHPSISDRDCSSGQTHRVPPPPSSSPIKGEEIFQHSGGN